MCSTWNKKLVFALNFTAKRRLLFLSSSGFCLMLASCTLPIDCHDAKASYTYWAGEEPPKNLQIIHGQYKKSPHFTLEYTLFLELAPNPVWGDSFKKLNNYIPDTAKWNPPANAPAWFQPTIYSKKWKSIDGFDNSRLIEDSLKSRYFVYIEQL